jgi:charged multivesicular body protein 5
LQIDKIEAMQDEMEDLMESANEVQESLGRNYAADDIDDADLEAGEFLLIYGVELDALGDDLLFESEEAPSYLQEPELDYLPSASSDPMPNVVPGGMPKELIQEKM